MPTLVYVSGNRHTEFVTQLPFEIKTTMPLTDRGKRGYSDEYIAKIDEELESSND